MTTATLEATGALLEVYKRSGPVFVAGEGCRLVSEDGTAYLDFTAGIAVNALGYASPVIADAIRDALETGLVHASNLFHTRPAAELAEWLAEHSFADRVFFCNSGAEANEGAFKFARRYARETGGDEHKVEVVAFHGSFHGRTMGALASTDRPAYQAPFKPLMPGVRFGVVGDVAGADRLIRPEKTAAVIIEPLQAEGGVLPVSPSFLKALRYLCDEAGALLIFDEVQVGLGRTGSLWAHEQAGVTPDLLTAAKPLAGGLPMGAVLMTDKVAETIKPGDHATTFGGGPLVASAALATVKTIGEPAFLAEVQRKGHLLANLLQKLVLNHPTKVKAVRGTGLIWGVEIEGSAGEVAARALDAGLLVCTAGPDVVRIVPPLVIGDAELAEGVKILDEVL
jgi:predicted acetylornithine/succinylornithine family transaminase